MLIFLDQTAAEVRWLQEEIDEGSRVTTVMQRRTFDAKRARDWANQISHNVYAVFRTGKNSRGKAIEGTWILVFETEEDKLFFQMSFVKGAE